MNRYELYIVGLLNSASINFICDNIDHAMQQYLKAIDAVKKLKLNKKETRLWFSGVHSNLVGLRKRNQLEQCLHSYKGLWCSYSLMNRIFAKVQSYLILLLNRRRMDRKTIEQLIKKLNNSYKNGT